MKKIEGEIKIKVPKRLVNKRGISEITIYPEKDSYMGLKVLSKTKLSINILDLTSLNYLRPFIPSTSITFIRNSRTNSFEHHSVYLLNKKSAILYKKLIEGSVWEVIKLHFKAMKFIFIRPESILICAAFVLILFIHYDTFPSLLFSLIYLTIHYSLSLKLINKE